MTGTTFDRPQLKQMLADAENGEISTIIVKDLSRFGRLSGMVYMPPEQPQLHGEIATPRR